MRIKFWRLMRQKLISLRGLIMEGEDYCHSKYIKLEIRAGKY